METRNENLNGRIALVTGAGRGIGQAIARGLATAGARVAVLARSADEVQQTVVAIRQNDQDALGVPADVTDPKEVSAALFRIADQWGPVEILVNNAATVWPLGASATINVQEWKTALAVNVTAPVALTFSLLPSMLGNQWGRIVNVSTGIAANPAGMPRGNAYVTTKAALEAHSVNLAAELKDSGVTVNVFRPGIVDTAMQGFIRDQDPARIGGGLHQRFVSIHEQGMLLAPEQSAASLLTRLPGEGTGQIWDADDDLATAERDQP